MVSVRGLSHRYAGRNALEGVSLEVAAGERVALVGPNGAGKSTLLLALVGALPAPPGAVRVAGLDPAVRAERARLPVSVGMVFQTSDDQLFAPTVAEDVAFGPLNLGLPPAEARSRAAAALEQAGVAHLIDRPPVTLSEGQKRRVALAGVFAMRPAVLLLDEPTVYLDPRGRRELADTLAAWVGTLIVATHELDFAARLCGRAVVMDAGRVVADGPAARLFADSALLERHGLA